MITYSLNWNSMEIYYVSLIPKFKLLAKNYLKIETHVLGQQSHSLKREGSQEVSS